MKVDKTDFEPVPPPAEYTIVLTQEEMESLNNVLFLFGENSVVVTSSVRYSLKKNTYDFVRELRSTLLPFDHSEVTDYAKRSNS